MSKLETNRPPRARFGLARRARPDARAYRLAATIRLPWIVGGSLLLLLAVGSALLLGRSTGGKLAVPRPVLDDQAILTQQAAQSVRRSLNEGVEDLNEAAAFVGHLNALTAGEPDQATLHAALQGVTAAHDRYLSVYVLRTDGQVLASLGQTPRPDLLESGPPFDNPGMEIHVPAAGEPMIAQFAPIPGSGGGGLTLVGLYDPEFLRFALQGSVPGSSWIVDDEGRLMAAFPPGTSPGSLPSGDVDEVEARGQAGDAGAILVGSELSDQNLLGFAPVTGSGPAGSNGWVVLSSRRVSSLRLPELDARRQGLAVGLILFFLTLLIFSWLYIVVILPILAVQKEAERLAFGNLEETVPVARYDEIGLIARALERIRILLIRRRIQPRSREEE